MQLYLTNIYITLVCKLFGFGWKKDRWLGDDKFMQATKFLQVLRPESKLQSSDASKIWILKGKSEHIPSLPLDCIFVWFEDLQFCQPDHHLEIEKCCL